MRKILRCILYMILLGIPGQIMIYLARGELISYVWVYENQPLGWAGAFFTTLAFLIPLGFYGLEPQPDPLQGLYNMEDV